MKKQYDEIKKQCFKLMVKEGWTTSSIQRKLNLGNETLNT